MQEAGVPDIIGWIPVPRSFKGDTVGTRISRYAIELKIPGNTASPLQEYQLRRWGAGGFVVGIVESLDDFKALVNGYTED